MITVYDATFLHTCICFGLLLQNLEPSTTYFYRPTSGDISSGPHFFKTPSANPVSNINITIKVISQTESARVRTEGIF